VGLLANQGEQIAGQQIGLLSLTGAGESPVKVLVVGGSSKYLNLNERADAVVTGIGASNSQNGTLLEAGANGWRRL
jgi:hypothetical protein